MEARPLWAVSSSSAAPNPLLRARSHTCTAKEKASHAESKTFLTAPQGSSSIFGSTGVRGKVSPTFASVSLRFYSNVSVKKRSWVDFIELQTVVSGDLQTW